MVFSGESLPMLTSAIFPSILSFFRIRVLILLSNWYLLVSMALWITVKCDFDPNKF